MKGGFSSAHSSILNAIQPLGSKYDLFLTEGTERKIEISFQHFFTAATRKAGSCFLSYTDHLLALQFHNHFITFASFWPFCMAVTLRLKRRLCIIASLQHLKQTHL
jgi:hypothetical protein